jgi:phosphate-selective porin OprO/OprP
MLLTAAICSIAWAGAPGGDDERKGGVKPTNDTPSTVETLSAELKAQRAELEAQRTLIESLKTRTPGAPGMSLEGVPNPAAANGDLDFKATFTDGFHLKSGDNFDLHIGGRAEVDYRQVLDRPICVAQTGAGARDFNNTFFLRDLFLTMDGPIYKDWGLKLNAYFSPQGSTSTTPINHSATIPENSWLEWKHFREFRIQAGQFKSPCEVETLESPLFTEFVSRSLMSRLVENQDLGVNIYGDLGEGLFTYQIAWQNGRDITANSGRSLVDDNDGKEWGARFTVAPFVQEKDSFLRNLRVGVWGSYGREGNGGRAGGLEQFAATGFQSTEFNVSYLEFTQTTGAAPGVTHYLLLGRRVREGGELTYAVGPLEIRGELMQRRDEFLVTSAANTEEDHFLATRAYYAQVTYIVTGEEKIPDSRISPAHNFDPSVGGWGAVELGVRYSGVAVDRHRLNDLNPAGNVIAAGNSNHVSVLTFGPNWWLTQNVRWAFNWVREHYAEGVTFLDSSPSGSSHRVNLGGLLTQIQIDF